MDWILDVLKDYWLLFVVGIVLLLVVQMLFKAIFKIALVAVIIGFVMIFVFNKTPEEVLNSGKQALQMAEGVFASTVQPLLEKEIAGAAISFQPDGSYELKTANTRIVGKKGEPTCTIYYGDSSYTANVSELSAAVQQVIAAGQKQ